MGVCQNSENILTNLKKVAKICFVNGNGNANIMISQNRRVTIKHVAEKAGVSTQTVSRVINNRPDVAPETRRRILEIIDELDYRPSELARSLIHRRSYTLGVVTAGLKYIGPNRTLNGITTKAEELGFGVLLKELPRFSVENVQPILQFFLGRHVDGILWAVQEVGNNRDWFAEGLTNIPVPILFLTMASRPGIPMLSIDNYAGGVMATQHLLEAGYRNIAHLSGPLDWWEARQRKQGWQDTLVKAGRKIEERFTAEGNWSSASGKPAFLQLLDSYPEMEAVFVANDQMALTVLRMACEKGLRVPNELGVVGFDDIAESAYFWPALTTVNQNQHELGCRAVEELVRKIEAAYDNETVEPTNILLMPELVIRESSLKK
jgi:LacI family transcriptional regulator